jgi:hypothetical protein
MEIHNMNNEIPVAFVDVDETLCHYEGERIYELALPDSDAIAKVNLLYERGWKIVIWTARGSSRPNDRQRLDRLRQLTEEQLISWGLKFHELLLGDNKPLFDLIIDDRAKRIEEL